MMALNWLAHASTMSRYVTRRSYTSCSALEPSGCPWNRQQRNPAWQRV